MTLFDLVALVTVLMSVLGGLNAGAVRELVGLTAFALAVGGAILLLPLSRPFAMATIRPDWAAGAAALAVVFLVIYFGLQLGGGVVTARLRAGGGALGALDRLGGGAIGLVRAGVLLGAAYLLYQAVTPAELKPPWIERAAVVPVARAAADALSRLAPRGAAEAGSLLPLFRAALGAPTDADRVTLNALTDDDADTADSTVKPATGKGGAAPAPPRETRRRGLHVVTETSR